MRGGQVAPKPLTQVTFVDELLNRDTLERHCPMLGMLIKFERTVPAGELPILCAVGGISRAKPARLGR